MEGNQLKMREALGQVRSAAHSYINAYDDEIDRIMSKIVAICDAALSAPPRQYDVGTYEEQSERHDAWCIKHRDDCDSSQVNDCIPCFAKWAQTPYEEERKGDGDGE